MSDDKEDGHLKVLDFKKKEQEDTLNKTKHDFEFDGTGYTLRFKVFSDGILLEYVHEVERTLPMIGTMRGLCGHGEKFICLNNFEKFLNIFGANITVESKTLKIFPSYKQSVIDGLKVEKEIKERQDKLEKDFGKGLK